VKKAQSSTQGSCSHSQAILWKRPWTSVVVTATMSGKHPKVIVLQADNGRPLFMSELAVLRTRGILVGPS